MYDALTEPERLLELMRRIDAGDEIEATEGRFSFHRADGLGDVTRRLDRAADRRRAVELVDRDRRPARVEGVPQARGRDQPRARGAAVPDRRAASRTSRRCTAGTSTRARRCRATLGVVQQFLPDAVDGWELALERIETDPEWFLDQLGDLGWVTARMHNVLASDAGDPAFAPEEPSQESLSLLTATVDEDIERIFLRLPDDERRRADQRPRAGCA